MTIRNKVSLEAVRASIPNSEVEFSSNAGDVFKFLPNNTDLTEEYLYAHQPTEVDTINVYATNPRPIGALDISEALRANLSIISGPVIVVARKGYAGRMFVVNDEKLIIHEDAYAVVPKEVYGDFINLEWFARHYSYEFQSNRTSLWGIGDFPREKFRQMMVTIPNIDYQREATAVYRRRDWIVQSLANYRTEKEQLISDIISKLSDDDELHTTLEIVVEDVCEG